MNEWIEDKMDGQMDGKWKMDKLMNGRCMDGSKMDESKMD